MARWKMIPQRNQSEAIDEALLLPIIGLFVVTEGVVSHRKDVGLTDCASCQFDLFDVPQFFSRAA